MYYSAIGLLAGLILLIINQDIIFNTNKDVLQKPAWNVYRRFLIAVLVYFITDVMWGILESQKLPLLLFADTTVYYVAMAVGVLFWAQYTVTYLENTSGFGRFLVYAGCVVSGLITMLAVINIFAPILFTIDSNCVYHALPARYVMLVIQIVLLLLISSYAVSSIVTGKTVRIQKNRALALFGVIMAVFLFIQLYHPFLPLYSVAYMLGTCVLHTFVVNDEKDQYRILLQEAYRKERSANTVFTHIARSLAREYTDLFYVNMETGEYVEFNTDPGSDVMTESRRGKDFFESCKREVKLFVHPDDEEKFVHAMDPAFLNKVLDSYGIFAMTYRRIKDERTFYVNMKVSRMEDDNRFIVIGVTDIDEQMKLRLEEEQMQEERVIFARLHALMGNFISGYEVDPETEYYRVFGASEDYDEDIKQAGEGADFFTAARKEALTRIYHKDLNYFLEAFTKENVLKEIERNGVFTLGYRMNVNGKPLNVLLKAVMMEEEEGMRLIVSVIDIDAQVRQEEEYGRKLAHAQSQANIDPLTGIKNRHAYLEAESRIDRKIEEHRQEPFSITILDVNNLKTINDTKGHQAGDQCIRDTCRIICDTFRHSPVFRIGGDEFAVISQGDDYAKIEELVGQMGEHNDEALRSGGIIIACGMSKFDNDPCVAAVFERADSRMYENKNNLKARG